MDNFSINEHLEALDPTTGKWGLARLTRIHERHVEVWFDGYNAKNGQVNLDIPADIKKIPIRKQTEVQAEYLSKRRQKQKVYLRFDPKLYIFNDSVSFLNFARRFLVHIVI